MDIQNIQKKSKKSVPLYLRTYEEYSKWLKENNISVTALFNEAVKELMEKKKASKKKK